MRPLRLAAAALTATVLFSPARSAPAAGWVDPPTQTAPPQPVSPEAVAPANDAPQAAKPATRPASGTRTADRPSTSGWATAARVLAENYLDSISGPNAASLAETPLFYARSVAFHGHTVDAAGLVAQKRRFFRRWPERDYATRPGSLRTDCSAMRAVCTVRTLFDFRAESPSRGARSRGLAVLFLIISFAGERPVIVSERSRVLQRG